VTLFAHDDVLRTSAGITDDATAPDELTTTPDCRRASVLVVTPAATQRLTVGLLQPPTHCNLAAGRPHTASSACGRTVVGWLVDVDQLILAHPSTGRSLFPLSSSSSPSTCFSVRRWCVYA